MGMFAVPVSELTYGTTLTSCDLVMSRTCLSLSASVISFVDNIPNESSTNIQGLGLLWGFQIYIRGPALTKILNCYNIDNYDTGEVDSTTCEKRFVNSVQCQNIDNTIRLESRKFLTTAERESFSSRRLANGSNLIPRYTTKYRP